MPITRKQYIISSVCCKTGGVVCAYEKLPMKSEWGMRMTFRLQRKLVALRVLREERVGLRSIACIANGIHDSSTCYRAYRVCSVGKNSLRGYNMRSLASSGPHESVGEATEIDLARGEVCCEGVMAGSFQNNSRSCCPTSGSISVPSRLILTSLLPLNALRRCLVR